MESVKDSIVKILLVVNLVLGALSLGGVGYLVYKQSSSPSMNDRMGGMTPPSGNFQEQQGDSSTQSSGSTNVQ